MAKLSDESLNEGRRLALQGDRAGFQAWVERNGLSDYNGVQKVTDMLMRASKVDPIGTRRLFDKTFGEVDPDAARAASWITFGCVLFVALGLLGGVLFLIDLFTR